jgi:cell division protease FtsH
MPASDQSQNQQRRSLILSIVVTGILFALWSFSATHASTEISYSDFKAAVAAGAVERVEVAPEMIHGAKKPAPAAKAGDEFRTVRVEDPTLLKDLEGHGVKVTGITTGAWGSILGWILPIAVLLLIFGGRMGNLPRSLMAVGQTKARVSAEEQVSVKFSDVAGVEEAKQELKEVIEFLRTPDKFRRLGGKIPKGVLLVGPPGTGKTLLARAVAGEAQVPFFNISGSEFVEMFVGVGAARVRDLFKKARETAPCIIFIDELDALGRARTVGPMAHEEREQTLNQLLVEMDGFDSRTGVILMAATNRPEILDAALLRAGRFDRHVLVDRPDKADRLAILQLHGRNVPLEKPEALEIVAGMTAGMVGADLANIVNEAALLAVRRNKDKVGQAELVEAVERIVAGLEKHNRVLSLKERERVAHHEIGHALVGLLLPGADPVTKISIIPRGVSALGYTMQVPTEDRFIMSQTDLENRIAVLLGGRAAEKLIFQDISTGAQDDLKKATALAHSMVTQYGMSPALGSVTYAREPETAFLPGVESSRGDYSEQSAQTIDAEVRRIIEEQGRRASQLLGDRLAVLRIAAGSLLAHETLTGDELRAILDRGAQAQENVTDPAIAAA